MEKTQLFYLFIYFFIIIHAPLPRGNTTCCDNLQICNLSYSSLTCVKLNNALIRSLLFLLHCLFLYFTLSEP